MELEDIKRSKLCHDLSFLWFFYREANPKFKKQYDYILNRNSLRKVLSQNVLSFDLIYDSKYRDYFIYQIDKEVVFLKYSDVKYLRQQIIKSIQKHFNHNTQNFN